MFINNLLSVPPLWDALAAEKRPVLLYGTGNGADKILDVMEYRGIGCAGVFASDGFVRDREFRGMKVMSYTDARAKFGDDTVILCAFGSTRSEVLDFLGLLNERHTLYIPDVPLFCDDLNSELFTREYLLANRAEIEECAGLWEDEESAKLYSELLAYRLSGKPEYLSRTEDFETSVRSLLPADIRRVIDGGAFTGDTARIFLSVFGDVREIICAEPDPRTFRKLSAYAEAEPRVRAVNAALGNTAGECEFSSSSGRSSARELQNRRSKAVRVPVVTADSLSSGEGKLLIKLDVEGSEAQALEGARYAVSEEKAALSVALYHRTADIFRLPLAVRDMRRDLRFGLRRARCVPAWEITMFAR